ncbi:MAG: aconitate hydratase AcnA [Pseudomonadota bacterium]
MVIIMDSFNSKSTFELDGQEYEYYDIKKAAAAIGKDLDKLPFSLKVIFENLLRFEDNNTVTKNDIIALANWLDNKTSNEEISYRPTRVLMQDFTGVPAVVDLAAMRDAVANMGADPKKINPLAPVDLVIDHSVQVDEYATNNSYKNNVINEIQRNKERYEFLRWGQQAFDNFRVVPPGTGICHQVNLEYLAKIVWTKEVDGKLQAFPDSLVGTDSHTTMINALAVLGWGVGGIEAEAVMLGQPISMIIPEVIGFKLEGKLKEGTTATDLVLKIVQMLREKGVVGKFVEFYGAGLKSLTLADRATIANMAPEYGATCGFFPIDENTVEYMQLTARDDHNIKLVEKYAKIQGMWCEENHNASEPVFTDILSLNISDIEPAIAGPKRPQDLILLSNASKEFKKLINSPTPRAKIANKDYDIGNGDIVIAAITSCTNTSNPYVMIGAGLVAKKAVELGIDVKPWVKTSLAPGSQVVTEYLEKADLQQYFDQIGFNNVGYGCTTCIGNSGPLDKDIDQAIRENDVFVTSVLSGNRNFEGRVHPLTKANYLASPPLVVAYAIAGSMNVDITKDVIAVDKNGNDVYLKDIWPNNEEIVSIVNQSVYQKQFSLKYADVFKGDEHWQNIESNNNLTYTWNDNSTYIQNPPFFEGLTKEKSSQNNIENANILALLGDSITTDHISPAGSIAKDSPAAKYLLDNNINITDFNSYGSRRGNHEVMMRGTFANIRIKNEMLTSNKEGGYTIHIPTNQETSIYDAAMQYVAAKTPLVIFAGKEYGTGSSRDWAAKGTRLLGVKAVIAESFERIHRSNLIGMGVLPLIFTGSDNRKTLNLTGYEKISIHGISDKLSPKCHLDCIIEYQDGSSKEIKLLCRLDTINEVEYYNNQGILHTVLRDIA